VSELTFIVRLRMLTHGVALALRYVRMSVCQTRAHWQKYAIFCLHSYTI